MALALFHLKQEAHWNSIKVSTVDFSWKSPGTQLSKYCKFWSCLGKLMFCVSPQVIICPTSPLIAHKNSYGSTTGRAQVRAKFFDLYLAQTIPIRNHQFQIVLSVKSESGHCLKFFCMLQSLKFPQICHQNLPCLLWKFFLYSSIS